MTVTLELRPEEVAALYRYAEAEGVDIETILHRLIAQIVPLSIPEAREKWELTEKTNDPEELAERDREVEEVNANLNRWRAEQKQFSTD